MTPPLANIKTSFHNCSVKCPECGTIQNAKVEHTFPFWTWIHECEKCHYIIMESEFDEMEPIELNNQQL